MSGGNFNYLCHKELRELLHHPMLEEMAKTLEDQFPASRAAIDTRALIDRFDQLQADLDAEPARTLHQDVWHDIEWWQSGDYPKESARAAIAAYEKVASAASGAQKLASFMTWIPAEL